MTNHVINIAGARGGSGTTTIAAALALFTARHVTTGLVPCEMRATAALLGLARPSGTVLTLPVTERLSLNSTGTSTVDVTIKDIGRVDVTMAERPRGHLIAVLRGPCYLGLQNLVTSDL